MKHVFGRVAVALIIVTGSSLAACKSTGSAFNPSGGIGGVQQIYWDMFSATPGPSGTPEPQVEFARLPIHSGSAVTGVNGSASNMLDSASNMLIDSSGRLWVLSFPPSSVETAEIFKLPLHPNSTPVVTLTFTGRDCFCGGITFDKAGNLWGVEWDGDLFEYTGPFTTSGGITPAVEDFNAVPAGGGNYDAGIAVDSSGNVYVPVTGSNTVAVFTSPMTSTSTPAYYLDGVTKPNALIFDSQGNLYVGTSNGIARFNSNNLSSGATPNAIDNTGMSAVDSAPYEAEFAFDKAGDLFDADCGNTGAIIVYPSVMTSFSATEAPSATFTDTSMTNAKCTWGIAVH